MNCAYALNRDKIKCRCCGRWLYTGIVYTHRINPHLPINKINKVSNLASMDKDCYDMVNDMNADVSHLDSKKCRNINGFREKIWNSNVKTVI